MNTVSIRNCPVCGGESVHVLRQQQFILPEGHPLAQGYNVTCCNACGFVFADTAVTQADYDVFYAQFSKYEDQKTSTGGGESPLDADRLDQTADFLARKIVNKKLRILDLGCANGGLLNALKRRGYENLHGVDPSPACVRITRSRGIKASEGSFFSLPNDLGKFDVVLLTHVLEHVQAVRKAVEVLAEIIVPDGLAYVEVPDAMRYAEHLVAPFQDFNTEHINHFSAKSLAQIFRLSGWEIKAEGKKTFLSAPQMPFPAIYVLAANSSAAKGEVILEEDSDLKDAIVNYIARSQELMDKIEARMQAVLQSSPEVIVWGTGQLALKLLAETSLGKARIAAFVDSNPVNHGKILRGSQIVSPEKIRGMDQPIIVTSILHQQAIATMIRDHMRLPNSIVLLQ